MAKFRKDFSKRATSEKFKNKENPETMKGKILNIARKIGIALGITGTIATTAVYADMKYNDAEISKGIIKMFSRDKSTDKATVPQGTFEQRQVDLMTQTTKKSPDQKPEPTEGGGEPDDEGNTGNDDFNPENPEQKDSIKTKNREPEGELRAKAETNETEDDDLGLGDMDFGDEEANAQNAKEMAELDKKNAELDKMDAETKKMIADAKAETQKVFENKDKANDKLIIELKKLVALGGNPATEFDWYEDWAKKNNITPDDLID